MLHQQARHFAGPNNGHATGRQIRHFQLRQFHGGGTDGHGSRADAGFSADALTGGDCLFQQSIQDAGNSLVVLTEFIGVFHLREDLTFTEHQAIQAGRHPHQVHHRILAQQNKQVVAQGFQGQLTALCQNFNHFLHAAIDLTQNAIEF